MQDQLLKDVGILDRISGYGLNSCLFSVIAAVLLWIFGFLIVSTARYYGWEGGTMLLRGTNLILLAIALYLAIFGLMLRMMRQDYAEELEEDALKHRQ